MQDPQKPTTETTPEPRASAQPTGKPRPQGSKEKETAAQINPKNSKLSPQGTQKTTDSVGAASWIGTLAVLIFLCLVPVIWFRGLGVLAFTETILREWTHVLLLIALPLIIGLYGWNRIENRKKKVATKDRGNDRLLKKFSSLTLASAVITVLGGAYTYAVHPYLVAQKYTSDTITTEETTSYADRAPWIVANNYAQRDQGEIIGDREDVHYVPADQDASATAGNGTGKGTSRYTVLVKERGILGTGGYEAVQTLTMPTTGTIPADASTFCPIPDSMTKRLNTVWPWHSLRWSIHAKAPLAHFDEDDAYGYCTDDNQPLIIVPLYSYQGFWNTTTAPNGAALYSKDGVEILTPEQLTEHGIEGPTYPRSLAETQRKSINAGGTLMQWLGSKYGYDLTDTDDEDANAGNPAEFTMISPTDRALEYVSPLTPRGSSQSITAISSVPAQQESTTRAPLTINTSTDLPATSTLVTAIKESSVAGDNAWTTRWSAGMTTYEILPARDGHWAASIGQGQAVSYRADIAPDGRVTVVNSETGQRSQEAEEQSTSSITLDAGKPLNEMSETELLDLIQDATGELQRRQANSN
ncbi:hypothetical protein [Rothia sp. ZJ932]|uniref:hypothetical protein n=1 Tax=Rothia sp. ZJ932 TaxID=2810516 RepID=UPI001966F980|nr:hypothetical protein [Rothia sp. ZJ932]QRZ62427.1 hypothetical protein JR346_04905 [Rothia sp. ZJ932]